MKTCSQCHTQKPLIEFYKSKSTTDGKTSACKDCVYYARKTEKLKYQKTKRVMEPVRYLLYAAKSRAKSKGLAFEITGKDLLLPTHCPILGVKLSYGETGVTDRGYGAKSGSATIDRIDNSLGYVPSNVQVISSRANILKSNFTEEEVQKLARYLKTAK